MKQTKEKTTDRNDSSINSNNKLELLNVYDFEAIKIKLASSEEILSWSYGEVTKPETINYRTQKPEKDGLFSERIFGPTKDYECYCGKYKKIRYKGIICDRCGVEVTRSIVRRERMGHIVLASPCVHIWFLRGVPSRIGLLLDLPLQQLEKVIYYTNYIITRVDEEEKKKTFEKLEKEYNEKLKAIKKNKREQEELELKENFTKTKEEISALQPKKIISEIEYQYLAMRYGQVFDAETGSEPIIDLLKKIDLKATYKELTSGKVRAKKQLTKKELQKLKLVKNLLKSKVKPESMFFTVLPVMPPDLRPMVQLDGGRYASSDLNDLYRRIINRNNRLKRLIELNSPEVIIRNEKRMLQEAVDALIDNSMKRSQSSSKAIGSNRRPLKSLADALKGKQGIFRQNLLGKRVDYSGRSVIVTGPKLKLFQCGLPKTIALELFKPLVARELINTTGSAINIKEALRKINDLETEVWEVLDKVIKDKYVLLNRAPTLHRLSIQAFQPVLTESLAIEIPSFVCAAFNADFDGDQMAVHLPLSQEAQDEAQNIMVSRKNILKPSSGEIIARPSKDSLLGLYWLTKIFNGKKGEGWYFPNFEEAIYAYDQKIIDLQAKIYILVDKQNQKLKEISSKYLETSVGRIILNTSFPDEVPFYNIEITKKTIDPMLASCLEIVGSENMYLILDNLKDLGYKYSLKSGLSFGIEDLVVPSKRNEIISEAKRKIELVNNQFSEGLISEKERKDRVISLWTEAENLLKKEVLSDIPEDGPIYSFISSGARGNADQLKQMNTMKGLVVSPSGETIEIPIESYYKVGLSPLEYFLAAHGARKGFVDTALRTAEAGYLTRRLVDVAQDLLITEEDCHDEIGRVVTRKSSNEIDDDFGNRILGRTVLEDIKINGKVIIKKGEIVNRKIANLIEKSDISKVRIRSVVACRTRGGICQKCFGYDLGREQLVEIGTAVGIVAAQSIGELGTQLTLRTFHAGGAATSSDITQGLPRVEEIFELHSLKAKGEIAKRNGIVEEIIEKDDQKIILIRATEKLKAKPRKRSKKVIDEFVDEYRVPVTFGVLVKKGQTVRKGQRLTEGSLDIKEILNILGKRAAEEYIIKEIKKIYNLYNGSNSINDKYVEVIVKKMFSKVKVKAPGDSEFIPNELIERTVYFETNEKLKKEHKKPIKASTVINGIKRIALLAPGFLSAASFIETSRVLIDAVLEGREDSLSGLKENVIIGKLIPAGTGFKRNKNKNTN